MDNLTHTLAGLMMARCGLERTTQRGAGMMMLAANMPDLDAITWFGGSTVYLEYHRGILHSLPAVPLVALLPMLMVRAKFGWKTWLASMIGVLSHPLLDWTNAYGVPLLMPFSMRRWRLDIVNIFDVWIWAILLGATVVTVLIQWLSPASFSAARQWLAWAAMIAFVGFDCLRFASHRGAVRVMESQLYEGAPPRRVTALPNASNPFRWRGVVELDGSVLITSVDVSLLRSNPLFDPSAGRRYSVFARSPEMDAVLKTRPFRVFRDFAQLPYWQETPVADGTEVALLDLRFGDPGNLGFGSVRAVVDRHGRVIDP